MHKSLHVYAPSKVPFAKPPRWWLSILRTVMASSKPWLWTFCFAQRMCLSTTSIQETRSPCSAKCRATSPAPQPESRTKASFSRCSLSNRLSFIARRALLIGKGYSVSFVQYPKYRALPKQADIRFWPREMRSSLNDRLELMSGSSSGLEILLRGRITGRLATSLRLRGVAAGTLQMKRIVKRVRLLLKGVANATVQCLKPQSLSTKQDLGFKGAEYQFPSKGLEQRSRATT